MDREDRSRKIPDEFSDQASEGRVNDENEVSSHFYSYEPQQIMLRGEMNRHSTRRSQRNHSQYPGSLLKRRKFLQYAGAATLTALVGVPILHTIFSQDEQASVISLSNTGQVYPIEDGNTGTPDTDPIPQPSRRIGVSIEKNPKFADAAQKMGLGSVRIGGDATHVENGQLKDAALAATLNEANKLRMPVFFVFNPNNMPGGETQKSKYQTVDEVQKDEDKIKNDIRNRLSVVFQYSCVEYIEIGNEPNDNVRFWLGNWDTFALFTKYTLEVIKELNENRIQKVTPILASMASPDLYPDDFSKFINALKQTGIPDNELIGMRAAGHGYGMAALKACIDQIKGAGLGLIPVITETGVADGWTTHAKVTLSTNIDYILANTTEPVLVFQLGDQYLDYTGKIISFTSDSDEAKLIASINNSPIAAAKSK